MEEAFEVKVVRRNKQTIDCTVVVSVSSTFNMRISGITLDQEEFVADSMFDAMRAMRKKLEEQGALLLCAGSRIEVFPSAMSRVGYKAYVTRLGFQARRGDLIHIFDYAGPELVGAVEQQYEFHRQWGESLRKLAEQPSSAAERAQTKSE